VRANFEVDCGRYRRVFDFQADVDLTLRSACRRCIVRFTADVGTQFQIVEAKLQVQGDPSGE